MKSFNTYVKEEFLPLSEALITLANQAYPKFNTVVILAGGAGSGKGFVKDKLLGVEGFSFDVDALKIMASKTPAIIAKIKDELGVDVADLGSKLKNPENTSKMHTIIGDYLNLDKKRLTSLYTSIMTAAPDRKPNLIFDVTLSSMKKLDSISQQVQLLGYDKKNIHLIWIVNDIEVAVQQNAKRDRVVPQDILVSTHRGASQTMRDVLAMGNDIKRYLDGDIVLAFNKVGVDSEVVVKKTVTEAPMYIKKANYFYIKKSGKPLLSFDDISKEIKQKIASYVPKNLDWV